ncbi:hypothetical protein [Thiohalobacter sp. COW1]|nr:hypothetical protein [Thiohalobacter sp. COW1]
MAFIDGGKTIDVVALNVDHERGDAEVVEDAVKFRIVAAFQESVHFEPAQ